MALLFFGASSGTNFLVAMLQRITRCIPTPISSRTSPRHCLHGQLLFWCN